MKRIINAIIYSFNGLISAFKSETAFRQDIFIFILGSIALSFLNLPYFEELLMLVSLFLILIAELVNTAIETTIDRIGEKKNELSKMAKDIGSSIVFLTFVLAIFIWSSVLLHNS